MTEPNPLAPFATHRMTGTRFEEHSVPVTVLSELVAYRDLVLLVARSLFFDANPARKRVPNGFEEGFDLVLREVQDGSAVCPLERRGPVQTAGQQQLFVADDVFAKARDLVHETIAAVAANREPPTNFPSAGFRLFNRFGTTLRKGEAIELGTPTRRAVRYDSEVRKRLVLLRESTYENPAEHIGVVIAFEGAKQSFSVQDDDGQTVSASLSGLDEESLRVVRTAAVHHDALRVRVSGVGAFDADDRLLHFASVAEVVFQEDEDLMQRLDVRRRLSVLASLPEGWLGENEGAAIPTATIEWVADVLVRAEERGLSRPYLYPTPEGSVQAEWSFPGTEVSAEFEPTERQVFCVGVHTKTGAAGEDSIPLGDETGLARFVEFVGRYAP